MTHKDLFYEGKKSVYRWELIHVEKIMVVTYIGIQKNVQTTDSLQDFSLTQLSFSQLSHRQVSFKRAHRISREHV